MTHSGRVIRFPGIFYHHPVDIDYYKKTGYCQITYSNRHGFKTKYDLYLHYFHYC